MLNSISQWFGTFRECVHIIIPIDLQKDQNISSMIFYILNLAVYEILTFWNPSLKWAN